MDGREGRCALGFIILGVAPLVATSGGACAGMVIFAAGLLISVTAAFF